jgi:hypothetical protein
VTSSAWTADGAARHATCHHRELNAATNAALKTMDEAALSKLGAQPSRRAAGPHRPYRRETESEADRRRAEFEGGLTCMLHHRSPAANQSGNRWIPLANDRASDGAVSATAWCLLVFLILMFPAAAQIPPSASELQAYRGLHAAAAKGDVAEIEKLVKAGAPIDARDNHARTPLHVAAFMRKPDAARALMRLGADANALEAQKYDIVTIAAVADDVPMLKAALEGGCKAGNITSPYYGTALIAAAHLGAEVV